MKQPPVDVKLHQVASNIFHAVIEDQYDLTMTFCRAQEFYESPYKSIRGKKFTINEFMRIYVKDRNEIVFTYPEDWAGFNVPGKTLTALFSQGIEDTNTYDHLMKDMYNQAKKITGSDNFYLIGTNGNEKDTFEHEMCHAFYSLNKTYKSKVNSILKGLRVSVKNKVYKHLIELGYCKKLLLDELNAYLTIDTKQILDLKFNKSEIKSIKQTSKALKEIFLSFFNK